MYVIESALLYDVYVRMYVCVCVCVTDGGGQKSFRTRFSSFRLIEYCDCVLAKKLVVLIQFTLNI